MAKPARRGATLERWRCMRHMCCYNTYVVMTNMLEMAAMRAVCDMYVILTNVLL